MLVGEQPGNTEDRAGEPFAGPAGQLLDKALDQAEIRREDAYVTNAVKHFRFRQEGGHPSAVLRGPGEQREKMFEGLVADLAIAGRVVAEHQPR